MIKNAETPEYMHSLLIKSEVVLLPGKSHGQRSLVGYSPWGHEESDMTERLHFTSLHLWASQIVLVVKTLSANAGDIRDVGSISGSGRSPG